MAHGEPLTAELITGLLCEGEGVRLDYKRDQYKFVGATDAEKAKLLKDVLAFANASRRETAYILIGVEEVPGKKAEIVGTTEHIDDAVLQQFINGKTDRKVTLSYNTVEVQAKQVGVIRIPVQQRPFALKQNYGPLKAELVYMRRGSTNDVASAADIYGMCVYDTQASRPVAKAELTFFDPQTALALGNSIETLHVANIFDRSEIPTQGYSYTDQSRLLAALANRPLNPEYWREMAQHVAYRQAYEPVYFSIKNVGQVTAADLKVELLVPGGDRVDVVREKDIPAKPEEVRSPSSIHDLARIASLPLMPINRPSLTVQKKGNQRVVTLKFRKVQPGQTISIEEPLYLWSKDDDRTLCFDATIWADEFDAEQRTSLTVRATCKTQQRTWPELRDIIENFDPASDEDSEADDAED